jgi:hypothetical protein
MKERYLLFGFLVFMLSGNINAQNYSIYYTAENDTIFYDDVNDIYIVKYLGRTSDESDTTYSFMLIPANKVIPYIKCTVTYVADSIYYLYEYSIGNLEGAQQNLFSFSIEFNGNVKINNKGNTGWYTLLPNEWNNNIYWFGDQGLEPTWSTGGFAYSSENLPGIGDANLRGKIGVTSVYGELSSKISDKIKEIKFSPNTGFVRKKTVIPVYLPESIIPLNYLDTLLNYNQRSYEIGWITNQATADKYTNLFTTAKNQIILGDSSAAHSTLENVLHEVDIDSTNNLTSEAYALLRYNTEYLINQITKSSTGLPVKQ